MINKTSPRFVIPSQQTYTLALASRYHSLVQNFRKTKLHPTPSVKMQFTVVIATIFAGVALAAPTVEERQTYTACSGLYGTSQCCATDVLGVADLDCANPPTVPTSADEFSSVCSAIGQRARCCVLPILGQDVLCQTPTGVQD
ncbi:Cerato-ulmin hydrophobin family [Hypoxylon fuscum]|nr:Cerato-ulmin hydrophobin family [Hypoxylon fuscum]